MKAHTDPSRAYERIFELEAEVERLREELRKAEPVLVAADRLREAYTAMIEGRDIGRLEDWSHA